MTFLQKLSFPLLLSCAAFCGENAEAIKEFGIARSAPVDGGFFFWKFKYVPAPYVIERRGLAILINGIIVNHGPAWPQFDYSVTEDPGPPPPGVSPLDDAPAGRDPRDEYWSRKTRYLHSIHSQEKAIEILTDLIKQTNLFHKVEPGVLPDGVTITTKEGKRVELGLSSDSKRAMRQPAQLLAEQNKTVERFKEYLSQNAILSLNTGLEHIVTGERAAKAIGILSDGSEEALKIKALTEIGVLDETDVQLHQIVNSFNRDKLRARKATSEKLDTDVIASVSVAPEIPTNPPSIATGYNNGTRWAIAALLICGFVILFYAAHVLRKKASKDK